MAVFKTIVFIIYILCAAAPSAEKIDVDEDGRITGLF